MACGHLAARSPGWGLFDVWVVDSWVRLAACWWVASWVCLALVHIGGCCCMGSSQVVHLWKQQSAAACWSGFLRSVSLCRSHSQSITQAAQQAGSGIACNGVCVLRGSATLSFCHNAWLQPQGAAAAVEDAWGCGAKCRSFARVRSTAWTGCGRFEHAPAIPPHQQDREEKTGRAVCYSC